MRKLLPVSTLLIALVAALPVARIGLAQGSTYEAGIVERFTVTAAAGAQTGAPMRLAAPAAEDQAEHEDQPAAGATMLMPQTTPATLPMTGASAGVSPFWWVALAVVGLSAAVIGAFRLIVSQISGEK